MFPDTRWTLVSRARGPDARVALHELLGQYWAPVWRLYRARGLAPEDAEELAQELFVELMDGESLARVDASRGRFRTWLRACATNHHLRWLESGRALKRGGAVRRVAMDTQGLLEAEAASAVAPDAEGAFDRAWAEGVMARAMAALRAEYADGTRGGDFGLVERAFGGTLPAYRELAAEAGMSVPQLKSFLHRARGRFRELLTREVRETVGEDQVEAELQALFVALAPS